MPHDEPVKKRKKKTSGRAHRIIDAEKLKATEKAMKAAGVNLNLEDLEGDSLMIAVRNANATALEEAVSRRVKKKKAKR